MLLAHISEDGKRTQTLKDHCFQVAEYARESAPDNLKNAAYFCGLIHDMGKAKQEFQDYMLKSLKDPSSVKRGSVNHTFAAVIWILDKRLKLQEGYEQLSAEILAYAVGAHHGLFDLKDINGCFGLEHRQKYNRQKIFYRESLDNFYRYILGKEDLQRLYQSAIKELSILLEKIALINNNSYKEDTEKVFKVSYFEIGLLSRLLLSLVIYGDRRDTKEFIFQKSEPERLNIDWNKACQVFETRYAKLESNGAINDVRRAISKQCLDFSSRKEGIYRLNVPTGGGKTLSSFRYALNHANKYNKKRIFYIVPFITILKQNTKDIRKYFYRPDYVLEHHSDVVNKETNGVDLESYEVLIESWNSPVIMTTLVQFMNSLFLGKTSSVNRMFALCDSVIIFDEIQSVPRKLAYMFNQSINFLVDFCKATVILCSATQPTLENIEYPIKLSEGPEMVMLSGEQLKVFNRTNFSLEGYNKYGISLEELADFCKDVLSKVSSVMCICNTKKQASKLFSLLSGNCDAIVYHISNNMCKAHIDDVLESVKELLGKIRDDKNIKVFLVATQIPEAGVDISFESVIRVLAGLDNIVQSDGRCNRNGEYATGTTYVVKLNYEAEKVEYLPDIKDMQQAMMVVLSNDTEDFKNPETVNLYFNNLYNITEKKLGYNYKKNTLFNLLSLGYSDVDDSFELAIPFKEVGKAFSVIDQNTVSIIVPYKSKKKELDQLIDLLEAKSNNLQDIYNLIEDLKSCVVDIFSHQYEFLLRKGAILSYFNDSLCILADSEYDDSVGILYREKEDGLEVII